MNNEEIKYKINEMENKLNKIDKNTYKSWKYSKWIFIWLILPTLLLIFFIIIILIKIEQFNSIII